MAKQRDKRKQQRKSGGGDESSGGGGLLTSFRSGMRQVAGTGGKPKAKTPMQRAWDIIFWVLILAAAVFFIFGRMRR